MKKLFLLIVIMLSSELYSQSLSVFDIDTSAFPTIKAKFYAFDASGNQILNLSPADFEVTEDGVKRNVTYVSCPAPKPPVPISSVLTIDVSGSMTGSGIGYAKEAAKAWVQALPLGQSECAITSFNSNNFFNQDFTTNRNRLLNRIEELTTSDGTDFNAALINPMSGGLLAVEKGKYKKIVILLTDGYSDGNETAIIQKANQINATVFCVTLGTTCPPILRNISEQTGGQWFENITTSEQAREVYLKILNIVQGGEPCDIEWESGMSCLTSNRKVEIKMLQNGMKSNINYQSPNGAIAKLEIYPTSLKFLNAEPGIKKDTTITISAINATFNVTNITSSNPAFTITPTNFSVNYGQSIDLTISIVPVDSGYIFTKFEIENDVCPTKYYASGGFPGKIPTIKTIKLLHPNGDEIFVVGTDTVITWEGIAPYEPVKIEYTTNNGIDWMIITNNVKGFSYNWKVPRTPSNQCLARITAKSDYMGCNNSEVQICNQVWMGCNLDVEYYRNGDLIPKVSDWTAWSKLTTGAWCYNASDTTGAIYGKLYNWYAVNDPRGLAPDGWHVPSDDEWKELEMCLEMSQSQADSIGWRGTNEGGKLKATGSIQGGDGLWKSPNAGATNESGFAALPGGWYYDYGGSKILDGKGGAWWSSTEYSALFAWYRSLSYDWVRIYRDNNTTKRYGFSVRCVRD